MKSGWMLSLVFGCCFILAQGCQTSTPTASSVELPQETLQTRLGIKANAPAHVCRGYLAAMTMQHPSISERDDYLDLYDKAGKWRRQIIIVFDGGLAAPKDRTRPIEISGEIGRIDMGGPAGTKMGYANDVVVVKSWRYLPTKDVPRKK